MQEPVVTYPGLKNIISFTYTRGHGISPGFAMVTCTPQEEWPKRQGAIRLEYAERSIEFPDCVTDNLSFTFDSAGQLWKLVIMDRRWKWRYGSINGRYNVRLPNGPVDKLDPRTEKTPKELIELLLKEMGEENNSMIGKLPEKLRPSVMWDHANPAQELANLCDQFGMSIVLRNDDIVGIYPRGWGDLAGTQRSQFSEEGVISDSGASDPPELPSSITFVCGPTRYQADFPLDCVNDDIDGLVKPINELSYAPPEIDSNGNETTASDWPRADIINFNNIPLFNPADQQGKDWNSYASPRELCRAGLYKKYRIRVRWQLGNDQPGNGGFKIGGYTGDEVDDIRRILPMGAELVEPIFDPKTGWYRPLNCIVWGVFAPGMGLKNNYDIPGIDANGDDPPSDQMTFRRVPMIYQARNPTTGQLVSSMDATVVPPEKYSVDNDTGIINFSERMIRMANPTDPATRTRVRAILFARVTITVSDEDTLIPHREKVYFQITDIDGFQDAEDLGTDALIIRDDDIFLRCGMQFDPSTPHLEHSGEDGIRFNREYIQEYAKERVTAEMRKYQMLGSRAVTYAGWVRADLSGDIVQVSYSLSSAGATTSISLNGEIAALVIPYSERRFLEKIRNEKLDQTMQEYNRMAFEKGYAFSRLSNLTRTGR